MHDAVRARSATAWSEASTLEQTAASSAGEDEVALFATHPPQQGLTTDLQAIAALIDEDAPQPARSAAKRKLSSLGEAQVCLALTVVQAPSPHRQRSSANGEANVMQQ